MIIAAVFHKVLCYEETSPVMIVSCFFCSIHLELSTSMRVLFAGTKFQSFLQPGDKKGLIVGYKEHSGKIDSCSNCLNHCWK